MKKFNIGIYITLFISIVLIVSLSKGLINTKKRLEGMTTNLTELGIDNSILRLRSDELKTYLSNKDTEHKITVDSILKDHKVKINKLKSYKHIETKIVYVDTNKVVPVVITPINDTLHRIDFLKVSKCISVNGHINTKDIETEIYIDKMESKNNIYITTIVKKNFWDWLFHRKGKEITKTTTDCGDIDTDTIIVE